MCEVEIHMFNTFIEDEEDARKGISTLSRALNRIVG